MEVPDGVDVHEADAKALESFEAMLAQASEAERRWLLAQYAQPVRARCALDTHAV